MDTIKGQAGRPSRVVQCGRGPLWCDGWLDLGGLSKSERTSKLRVMISLTSERQKAHGV